MRYELISVDGTILAGPELGACVEFARGSDEPWCLYLLTPADEEICVLAEEPTKQLFADIARLYMPPKARVPRGT